MSRSGDMCVQLEDSFEHKGPHGTHVCMTFPVYGENLLALIKHYDYRGIPLPIVRRLASQVPIVTPIYTD